MCRYITYKYEDCSSTWVHNFICHNHILHTHKQIDTRSCPDSIAQLRHLKGDCSGGGLEQQNHKCRRPPGLRNEPGKTWEFQTVGRKLPGPKKRSKVVPPQVKRGDAMVEDAVLGGTAAQGDEAAKGAVAQALPDISADPMSKMMQVEGGQREVKRRRSNNDKHGDEIMEM